MTKSISIDPDERACTPIHIPDSIQPHGVMLVCEIEGPAIAFASTNAASELELQDAPLDWMLDDVLGHDSAQTLREALAKAGAPPAPGILWNFKHPRSNRSFDVVAHEHERRLIVELEPVAAPAEDEDALELAQSLVRRISVAGTLEEIVTMGVRLLRAELGYDRVMLYRFMHDGAGRVVAEARRSDLRSLLGQHASTAGFPEHARHFHVRNWLRHIPDARHTPVPLVTTPGTNKAPVDMSYSHLRSVSPLHGAYLRNMGVRASLTISIVIDGALWGMFACHHDSVRKMSLRWRIAAEMFGRHVSLQIASAERQSGLQAANEAIAQLNEMARDSDPEQTIEHAMRMSLPQLKQLVECDGAALWIHGQWTPIGSTPASDEIGPVLRMLHREGIVTLWSTNELGAHHGLAPSPTRIAGVLAIPLSGGARDYLFLFRHSFDLWREDVRGRALAWSDADLSIAETIMTYWRNVALRHYERSAQP